MLSKVRFSSIYVGSSVTTTAASNFPIIKQYGYCNRLGIS